MLCQGSPFNLTECFDSFPKIEFGTEIGLHDCVPCTYYSINKAFDTVLFKTQVNNADQLP